MGQHRLIDESVKR